MVLAGCFCTIFRGRLYVGKESAQLLNISSFRYIIAVALTRTAVPPHCPFPMAAWSRRKCAGTRDTEKAAPPKKAGLEPQSLAGNEKMRGKRKRLGGLGFCLAVGKLNMS